MGRQLFTLFFYTLLLSFPQSGFSNAAGGSVRLSSTGSRRESPNLTFTVKNINGTIKPGALVKLYVADNSTMISSATTNSSGEAVFSGLSDGTYNFWVSYSPTISSPVADNTEFWGSGQITMAGSSQSVSFTRNQPYIAVESTFKPATLKTGQSTSGSLTVKNILSGSTDSYIAVWVDRDKASTWDFTENLPAKTIIAGSTASYPFTVKPIVGGTYYYYAFVYSKVNGSFVITDQYSWTQAFTVENQELTIQKVTVNGTVFGPGSTVHANVSVLNQSPNPIRCSAEIRIDRDKLQAFDFESGYRDTLTIQPNQQVYFGFDWEIPVDASPGTYFIDARIQDIQNSALQVSDSSDWNTSISIENTAISQIQWSGYTWDVKNGSNLGPGPNYWLGNTSAVWVDSDGNLHLKIRKSGSRWYCSEISTKSLFGFGEYTFQLKTDVEKLDQNIVLGLFTYENDTREIDIEFSRWSDPTNPMGKYVVQPASASSHNNFSLNLPDANSTHKFRWNPAEIFFQSYIGNAPNLPDQSLLINQWSYTGTKIPPDGNERVVLNLWLNKGLPPSDLKEAEVIIKSFTFKKVGNLSVQVLDAGNTSSPEPGSNATVQLYNSDNVLIETRQTNQNGETIFSLKPEGSGYYCRVFHQVGSSGSTAGQEYWGTLSNITIAGDGTSNRTFKRDQAYLGAVKVFSGVTEVTGQSFEPGTELRIEQQLINPSLEARSAKASLLLDMDKTEPWNKSFTNPDFVSIAAEDSITSSWIMIPAEEGTYYYNGSVQTLLNGSPQICDTNSWSAAPLFTIKHVNIPPVAHAGPDQSADEGTMVTLNGTASTDPDNDLLTYFWTAPEAIKISSASASKPTFTAPEVLTNTSYTFSLIVNDEKANSTPDQVIITIRQVNKAPAANAGANQTVDEGTMVTLDGTASTDPDNDLLDYFWTAPEGIILSSVKSSKPTFTAPEIKKDTILNFSLIVNDGLLNSMPSTVQISVQNVIKTSAVFIAEDRFKIYPNPTKGKITVEGLPTNKKTKIEVFTLNGKLIMSCMAASATFSIDLGEQSAGTYLVKINSQSSQIEKE
jgi:hypothetical protein